MEAYQIIDIYIDKAKETLKKTYPDSQNYSESQLIGFLSGTLSCILSGLKYHHPDAYEDALKRLKTLIG